MRFASLTMIGFVALPLLGSTGCGEEDSKTLLNPAGPPMVRQVFMKESVQVDTDGDGTPDSERVRTQLAFGKHKDISLDDDPQDGVSNAITDNNTIRVIIDELLDGSTLEQVGCGRVEEADNGDRLVFHLTWSDIPSGTTPDDIADCTGVDRSRCTAVCTVPHEPHGDYDDSEPMGVVDGDDDGAADLFRFKSDIVEIKCEGETMPLVTEGDARSFWNPSGNQQIPAGAIGIGGIGPAIVLEPVGLRTGADCTIEFADSIVDKDGNPICAPPDGDIDQSCPGTGDTSLIQFGTQVFKLIGSSPSDGQQFVKLDSQVLLSFSLDVDDASIAGNFALDDGGTPVSSTLAVESDNTTVSMTPDAMLQPETTYTVSITGGANGVKEIFGGGLAEDASLSFTTCLANDTSCDGMGGGVCCSGVCHPDTAVCAECLADGIVCTNNNQCCGSSTCTMPMGGTERVCTMGTTPDAGVPDAGTPDAGTPDAMP